MRICIYCQKWESGGIESFLHNMLTHMDRTGLEIDLVADKLCPSVFTQPLEALGVRFVELSGSLRNVGGNRRRFVRLLAQRQYDTVHVNAFQGLSLAMLKLAQQAGVPVRIAHSHNTDLRPSPARQLKLWLHNRAKHRYSDCATHRWACSAAAAEFLFVPTGDWCMIPNGIDTAQFTFDSVLRQKTRQELGLNNNLLVGNVGRLCSQKNQDFLLEVFGELFSAEPLARLLLVGEGDDFPALRQKAQQLGILDAVIFYGTAADIAPLYQAMDVFAFPSRFEGLGIVAVEAQTAGLPVLCSEGVPDEAMVTTLAVRLPLSAGPAAWAKTLLTMKHEDRTQSVEAVRRAGYDVKDAACRLEWSYRGKQQ